MHPDALGLTKAGRNFVTQMGIDLDGMAPGKAPMCRECLDWSMRQSHLAGKLGRAMLTRFEELKWAHRVPDTRIIRFSDSGRAAFDDMFGALSG